MINATKLHEYFKNAEHTESLHCRAKNIGNDFILKICNEKNLSNFDFSEEISRANEASKHNIGPKVVNFGYESGYAYILMEKLKVSLKCLLEKDKLQKKHIKSLKKILKLMWKRSNFLHMDLHAENVWFNTKGDARLIDYGMTIDKTKLNEISESNPFILHFGYDDPPIIDAPSALKNSSFDIISLIDSHYDCSRKKKNLENLKKIMQGSWMSSSKCVNQ